MRRLLVLISGLLLAGAWVPYRTSGPIRHFPSWVEDAIEAGRSAPQRPYELRSQFSTRSVVGELYTPFLRVAMESRRAADAGHVLDPDHISAAGLEAVTWVRFYSIDALPPGDEDGREANLVFGIIAAGTMSPIGASAPRWVKRLDRSLLSASPVLGDAQTYIIAGFDVHELKSGFDLVAYRHWQRSNGLWKTWQLRGAIRDDDARAWR